MTIASTRIANTVARARTRYLKALLDRVTLKRPAKTVSSGAGYSSTLSTVATSVPCMIKAVDVNRLSQQMQIVAKKYEGKSLFSIKFLYSQDVRLDDEAVNGSTTYKIVSIAGSGGTIQIYQQAVAVIWT